MEAPHEAPQLLTVKSAAERSGIPVSTLYRLARTRAVRHTRIGGRIYFTPKHLDEIAAAHEVDPVYPEPALRRHRLRAT